MRTRFVRSRPGRRISSRRKPKFMWVRDTHHNVGPVAVNSDDWLFDWRTDMSLSANFNLPDFTVYRTIMQVSLQYHLSAAAYPADTGCWFAVYTDSSLQAQNVSVFTATQMYAQKYMLWYKIYHSEGQMFSPFAATVAASTYSLYKSFDIKTRRKLQLTDSVFSTLQPTGNMVLDQYDVSVNCLIRLP